MSYVGTRHYVFVHALIHVIQVNTSLHSPTLCLFRPVATPTSRSTELRAALAALKRAQTVSTFYVNDTERVSGDQRRRERSVD